VRVDVGIAAQAGVEQQQAVRVLDQVAQARLDLQDVPRPPHVVRAPELPGIGEIAQVRVIGVPRPDLLAIDFERVPGSPGQPNVGVGLAFGP
jgi:hypothetical protein